MAKKKPQKAWMVVEASGRFYEPGEGATTVCKTRNLARSLSTFDQKVIRVTIIPE